MAQFEIEGLSHITFICKDINKTAEFFKRVFKAKEIYSSGDDTFSVAPEKFFEIGGLWIVAMEKGNQALPETYNHVAFKVSDEDLALIEAEIRQLGLRILPGRKRLEEGEAQSLYFYDDDNHLFELHTGTLETRLAYYRTHKPNS